MNLQKAIEILELAHKYAFDGDADDYEAALQLGIEALKRHQDAHGRIRNILEIPLPGETEE